MKKLLPLFLFLFVFSSIISAQQNFRAGYIILNNQDTLVGLVDYRGEIKNAKICAFKRDSLSDETNYAPGEIEGYRFLNGKYYVTKNVIINGEKQSIFAEYLLNGTVDLYYYKNNIYEHYFIEKEGVEIQELIFKDELVTTEQGTYQHENKKYIGTLNYMFSDCKKILPEVQNVELNDKSLINITRKYHNYVCDSSACIVYEKVLPMLQVKIAAELGMHYWNYRIMNDDIFSYFEFNNSNVFPSLALLLDFTLPRWNEKLSLQTKFSLNQFYLSPTAINDNLEFYEMPDFSLYSLSVTYSIQYTYPKNKLRPILALGFQTGNINFLSGSNDFTVRIINSGITYSDKIILPDSGIYGKTGFNYHLRNKKVAYLYFDTSVCKDSYYYIFGSSHKSQDSILSEYKIGLGLYL